jgi:hypothetical protein
MLSIWGTRYCSWLRHFITRCKVVSSISDKVIGFFKLPTPSSGTVALGSTQHPSEISTRNLPEGKERPALKADLTSIYVPFV